MRLVSFSRPQTHERSEAEQDEDDDDADGDGEWWDETSGTCRLMQVNSRQAAVRIVAEMLLTCGALLYILAALREARFLGLHMFIQNLVRAAERSSAPWTEGRQTFPRRKSNYKENNLEIFEKFINFWKSSDYIKENSKFDSENISSLAECNDILLWIKSSFSDDLLYYSSSNFFFFQGDGTGNSCNCRRRRPLVSCSCSRACACSACPGCGWPATRRRRTSWP